MATTAEIGYLAGIIDGEGWMYVKAGHPTLAVKMTDQDTIERLHAITGVGHVVGPYERTGRKPIWQWTVSTARDVAAVLMTVFPLLSARRRAKAAEVLEAWRAMPFGARRVAACGTPSGYNAHRRRGEETCAACRGAHNRRLTAWRKEA